MGKADRGPRRIAAFIAAFRVGALLGLLDRLCREDAIAQRQPAIDRHAHQPPRGLAGDDLEMKSFASNDAAERDRAVIGAACRFRCVEGDRHSSRDFQRARYADKVVGRACGFNRADSASQKIGADRVVIPRLNYEKTAAFEARHSCGGPTRLGHRFDLLGCIRDGKSIKARDVRGKAHSPERQRP